MCVCVCVCVRMRVRVGVCVCLCVCVYFVIGFFWHSNARPQKNNNASAGVVFFIDSRQIFGRFCCQKWSRGGGGRRPGGVGDVPGGWVSKKPKKTRPKVMPRGARFEPFGNPWASVGCFSGVKMESWMSFSHVLFRFDSRFVFS